MGRAQCSGKGTQAALEVGHTPGKVCAEGGVRDQVLGLYVGHCEWGWCGSVFASRCGCICACERRLRCACASSCVGEHVYGLCSVRCLCGQQVLVLLSMEFASPSMFSLNVY
jgi:hypothetical protein